MFSSVWPSQVRVLSLKALVGCVCVPQLGQSDSGPDSFAGDP